MSTSARLRASDHRDLARLSHECRDPGDDPVGWRMYLAARLARLTGCALVSVVESGLAADESATGATCEWGWENGFDRSAGEMVLAKLARNPLYNPMVGPYLSTADREDGVCLSRHDLVSDARWYRSAYYGDYRECGGDATLLCCRQLGDGLRSGLVLIRLSGEPDFGPRQKAIAREANALIAPLIGGPLARFGEPSPAALPPRVRQVLRCLLEGDSDKQIAARLGLSRFTVNEYTKRAYRHFRAAGRTELLARWISRGWGNRFAWDDAEERQ